MRDGLAVTQALRSMQIKGVGDRVIELNARGDRIETYEVMNYVQGSDGGMSSMAVGMYSDAEEKYTEYEQAVVWPGNTTVVPVDHAKGACLGGFFLSTSPSGAPHFGPAGLRELSMAQLGSELKIRILRPETTDLRPESHNLRPGI